MLVYVAILGIVFLFLFMLKKEPFEESKKGILVLTGESFRKGNRHSRETDCDECIETQKAASESHMRFIQFVKDKYNITMDVLINTYDTKYEETLKGYYNTPEYYSHKELVGWHKNTQTAVDKIDKNKYEFILISRIDIVIKPEFYTVFNPGWKKINFFSPVEREHEPCGFVKNENGLYYPQINPSFMFFPKKYFYVLEKVDAGHHAWNHYMLTYQLTEEDMELMIDYQFDPNTATIANPYYKMCGRPESSVLMDTTKEIPYPLIQETIPTCGI